MGEDASGGKAAALRVLRAASEEVDALSRGTLSPEGERRHILRVANAVDRSLRRLLRDDERADLSIRLKALAPDEIRPDAVLAELRRTDRLSIAAAAAVHELLEIRRGLEGGGLPAAGEAERTVRAAHGLEAEIRQPAAVAMAPDEVAASALESEPNPDHSEPAVRRSNRWLVPVIGAAVAVAAVLGIGYYLLAGRGPDHMANGIALFRSGAYADAAHHFWRHAEANADDVTPHLYLARIHRRMNRPELAAESIREAQRIAPDDPAVHRELGFLLLDTGQSEVAVDRFRRALELDSASSEGWVGLVRALRESGRPDEAASVLGQAPPEVRALIDSPGAS